MGGGEGAEGGGGGDGGEDGGRVGLDGRATRTGAPLACAAAVRAVARAVDDALPLLMAVCEALGGGRALTIIRRDPHLA